MSDNKGKSKLGGVIVAVVIAVLLCAAAATIDSCKRLNRPCFGTSQK
jgi:hypothetical protein